MERVQIIERDGRVFFSWIGFTVEAIYGSDWCPVRNRVHFDPVRLQLTVSDIRIETCVLLMECDIASNSKLPCGLIRHDSDLYYIGGLYGEKIYPFGEPYKIPDTFHVNCKCTINIPKEKQMKPEIYGLKTKAHLKQAWGIVEHINECGGVKIKKAAFGWKKGNMITTLELVDGRTSRVSAPATDERTTIESGVFYAYVRASGKKKKKPNMDVCDAMAYAAHAAAQKSAVANAFRYR